MSTINGLYRRFRLLIHEGAKFLVVGLMGTIVTFGVANALQGIGRYKAITIATILATVVTYLGNGHWAFRSRQGQGTTRDSIVFFVLNGIGLFIYYGCIALTDLAGLGKSRLWYNMALVVGTGLGTLFRWWSYRKWVWVAVDTVPAEAESGGNRGKTLAQVGAAPVARQPAAVPAHQPRAHAGAHRRAPSGQR